MKGRNFYMDSCAINPSAFLLIEDTEVILIPIAFGMVGEVSIALQELHNVSFQTTLRY